jgi:hypothetical protein
MFFFILLKYLLSSGLCAVKDHFLNTPIVDENDGRWLIHVISNGYNTFKWTILCMITVSCMYVIIGNVE